jgi:glucokinase
VRAAIGIDVGGTKVAGLLVREDGAILSERVATTPAEDVDATMATIYEVTAALREGPEAVAVGVGAAGMVEFAAGALRSAPNLAWKEVPIRDLVAERTGLPALVDNDANVAAWGEFRMGAGRGYRDLLIVTVGTGIGGGIISGGRLLRGAHGFAAEIGHIIVEPGGPECGCGNRGCWEQVASGRALDRAAVAEVARDPHSPIATRAGGRPTGRDVWEAAREGDAAATGVLDEVGRRLGEGIAGLVNVLDPQAVIVGGGVAEIGEPLLSPARRAFVEAVEAPEHRPDVPLVPAELGNRAGAVGAALLALVEVDGPGALDRTGGPAR